MIREQRLNFIEKSLSQTGIVTIDSLMKAMDSSRSTVYRDLFDLEKKNVLKCVRGGAVSVSGKVSSEPTFRARQVLYDEEKQRIAKRALDYIDSKATLFLDAGTTTFELANLLAAQEDLYIATNDLVSAMALSNSPGLSTIVLGGSLRPKHFSMNGAFTEELIQQIHADIAFLSVDAVDINTGLMCFSMDEVISKRTMINSSLKSIVLCDHSKFHNVAFVKIVSIPDIDIIITGKEADPDIISKIKSKGVQVDLV